MYNNSINEYKDTRDFFKKYIKVKQDYNIIHYVRQNCFDDSYEKGSRIIAIAVMNADSEQITVFSLKQISDRF